MPETKTSISVIIPALNEEKTILLAVVNTLTSFTELGIDGEVVVVNDGSSDKTGKLVNDFLQKDNRVKLVTHQKPQGIGASFWDGVDNASKKAVMMLPGDDENEPGEILRYHTLLEHLDIISPYFFNRREVRTPFRNALSAVFLFIINNSFAVNFNYTNGCIIYRKSILKELSYRCHSFFYQTDILIRAVKKGYLFAEIPSSQGYRREGRSKAVSLSSLLKVISGYLRLMADYYIKRKIKMTGAFAEDSLTLSRYENARIYKLR